MEDKTNEKRIFVAMSILAAIATALWCHFLGGSDFERASLACITFCSAFMVGSIFGFLFTIFGDEIGSFGKIQNAVVAVASGIAGVGLAKVNVFGTELGQIQLFSKPSAASSWFSTLAVVTYSLAGFYFMYLLRKLIINPALAKSRREMDLIEQSGTAESAATEVAKILTPDLLLGQNYVGNVIEAAGSRAPELRKQLYSEPVNAFLESCNKDIESGVDVPLDNITRAAVIHYYRTYFVEGKSDERTKQEQLAETWLERAMLRNPTDPGLQIKLADIYGMSERYAEVVSILERLDRDITAPQFVSQWLGYYLLFIDGRERDAIKFSREFYERFPESVGSIFNAACGYAQLYANEVQKKGANGTASSKNRRESLKLLKRAVELDPKTKSLALRYAVSGDSFESLASDPEFRKIVTEPQASSTK